MKWRQALPGFSLIEVIVAVAIFVLFAVGIYGAASFVLKIVYRSRLTVLETAVLSEELEVARNLPYESIGTVGGVVSGVLSAQKTVSRDGIAFLVTTTVRNIDDPFDGTVGGSPRDSSPADFKLVEVAAICRSCAQKQSIVLSTQIGPRGLEGSTKNGALFINVFDAAGQPVVGANVHIVNTSTTPPISTDDVTDQYGYLRLVDTPTGTASYAITVTKNGYSSDATVTTSASVANPVKPPANVVSQNVTELSFSIDELSNLAVHTQNQLCAAIPSIGFNLLGAKLIGKDPDVHKFNNNYITDGSGDKTLSNIEWDTYDTSLTGNGYDIAGTIPVDPFYLVPGSSVDLTLVLRAHTANSLLVKVLDAGTGLPVSNATVRLYNSGYDNSLITGVGYMRQTDWSSGSNTANFVEGKYWSDDGNLVFNNPAGDVILKKVANKYVVSGWLESSTFDFGSAVNFQRLVISPATQPAQSGSQPLLFRFATSSVAAPASWRFTGPDGTTNSYYSPTSTQIFTNNLASRYARYRAYLFTANTGYTPRLSELAITYTNACTPPGQAFFDSLSATTYSIDVTASGYQGAGTTIDVSGRSDITVRLAD